MDKKPDMLIEMEDAHISKIYLGKQDITNICNHLGVEHTGYQKQPKITLELHCDVYYTNTTQKQGRIKFDE